MKRGSLFAIIFGAVVLLGTAGAVSRFVGKKERPKAYECKVVLRDILWAQRAYRDANGRYAPSLEELKLKLPEKRVYTYAIETASADDFTATCAAPDGDRWTLSPGSGEPVRLP
jgi:hypothetical protein